ncbi:MAG: transcriptional repressor LexA [Polyangiales bacterium]
MAYTTPGETRSKVLAFVRERLLKGEAPTVREVQSAFGFRSVESARAHLEALVEEGRLTKLPGQSRGYRLAEGTPAGAALVPLVGRVAAGRLREALEDPDGYVAVRADLRGEHFALRVEGESMVGAGILPGDVVVVRRQPTARDGDVVVARVGDEATVKTLRRRGGAVVLEPANPAFSPIVVTRGDLAILGRVVEVRRSLEQER